MGSEGMRNIRLVASDLDGTLFLSGTRPSEKAYRMIRELLDHDVVFVAASGRQYENMREVFAPFADEIGYICYNGGLTIYRGETVCEFFLDHALAREIITAVESTADCDAMASIRGTEVISRKDPALYPYMTGFVGAPTRVVDDLSALEEPIFKIAMYNADGHLNAEYWKARFGDRCNVLTSGNVWLDFVPKELNKGVALKELASSLGITADECLALGDNENDRGMLLAAGHPVTMKTSNPSVIGLGEYTAASVEEALSREFPFLR